MSKIIALCPKQCLGFGGAFTVYEGLGILSDVDLQTFDNFKPTSNTELVIAVGCLIRNYLNCSLKIEKEYVVGVYKEEIRIITISL